MRYLKHSTRAERIFHEVLKDLKISFRHRWLVNDQEVDFIVGNYAIEINGHTQDVEKNKMLVSQGYTPIHFSNKEVTKESIKQFLIKINDY